MKAKTTEQMIAEAKAAGLEVRVTERPKGGGEIVPLPGIRQAAERAADLAEDDDGSGVAE